MEGTSNDKKVALPSKSEDAKQHPFFGTKLNHVTSSVQGSLKVYCQKLYKIIHRFYCSRWLSTERTFKDKFFSRENCYIKELLHQLLGFPHRHKWISNIPISMISTQRSLWISKVQLAPRHRQSLNQEDHNKQVTCWKIF